MNIIGKWTLISVPFKCRQTILSKIVIDFGDNNGVLVCDTANYSNGNYTVNFNNDLSGLINIKCLEWTERTRICQSEDEWLEAKKANDFIHNVIRSPIPFTSENNVLKIKHLGNTFEFTK